MWALDCRCWALCSAVGPLRFIFRGRNLAFVVVICAGVSAEGFLRGAVGGFRFVGICLPVCLFA